MASLKDKLRSKIKPKNEPETMQSFDQSSLQVFQTQGKTQLHEFKIHCQWNNNKINLKPPKLKCKWYNRTDKNYQEIPGVEEDSYQPSILDIGSIIEITCIPEMPGYNYEGMPILIKSQPIALATETELEANKLYQNGKGKFLVSLKQAIIGNTAQPTGNDAILQINNGSLSLTYHKHGEFKDQIQKTIKITEQYPGISLSRKNSKRMQLKLSAEQSYNVLFKNNQVRDVFSLFLKIFLANKTLDELNSPPQSKEELKIQNEHQNSEQKIQNNEKEEETLPEKGEVSSNQSLKQENTPKVNSTTDLLQLLNLKQEIKRLESEKSKITKELEQEKQKAFTLENKLLQSSQRVENASKNYFSLELQLNNEKATTAQLRQQISHYQEHEDSKKQELVYYKNQIKLLGAEKTKLQQQLQLLQQQCSTLAQQNNHYKEIYQSNNQQTYQQLLAQFQEIQRNNEELKLKKEYIEDEKEKLEETLKNSRNLIEQIEWEKKSIEKKYQSLTNEISNNSLSPSRDKSPQMSLSSSFIFEQPPALQSKESFLKIVSMESEHRQRQILQLKKQIKLMVDENNNLRSLLTKQKKPSSKTHLKLQLIQAKKIVSRLSQALAQKQNVICQLSTINKQLNRRTQLLQQKYHQLLQQQKQQ